MPVLFNIVDDMLAVMIDRAKSDGQIEGVIPHLIDGGFVGVPGAGLPRETCAW